MSLVLTVQRGSVSTLVTMEEQREIKEMRLLFTLESVSWK